MQTASQYPGLIPRPLLPVDTASSTGTPTARTVASYKTLIDCAVDHRDRCVFKYEGHDAKRVYYRHNNSNTLYSVHPDVLRTRARPYGIGRKLLAAEQGQPGMIPDAKQRAIRRGLKRLRLPAAEVDDAGVTFSGSRTVSSDLWHLTRPADLLYPGKDVFYYQPSGQIERDKITHKTRHGFATWFAAWRHDGSAIEGYRTSRAFTSYRAARDARDTRADVASKIRAQLDDDQALDHLSVSALNHISQLLERA